MHLTVQKITQAANAVRSINLSTETAPSTSRGWRIRLDVTGEQGERSFDTPFPFYSSNQVLLRSIIPKGVDPCDPGARYGLMVVNAADGTGNIDTTNPRHPGRLAESWAVPHRREIRPRNVEEVEYHDPRPSPQVPHPAAPPRHLAANAVIDAIEQAAAECQSPLASRRMARNTRSVSWRAPGMTPGHSPGRIRVAWALTEEAQPKTAKLSQTVQTSRDG